MFALRKSLQSERGFTLVEVTIILLVLVILSTIMLPQLGNFNRLARYVVVSEDVGAICASLKKFLDEVMLPAPYSNPGGGFVAPTNPVGLLVGPGSIPGIAASVTSYNVTLGDVWDEAEGSAAFSVDTDGAAPSTVTFDVDNLNFHLQVNAPQFAGGVTVNDRYKNVLDDPSVGPFFGWRGPYFNQINADPWGTRYSVNTFGLHSGTSGATDDVFWTAVICVSFGPNKTADTEPNMPGPPTAGPAYAIGGDDVAAILSAAGPF